MGRQKTAPSFLQMIVITNRQLRGDYGLARQGQEIEVSNDVGTQLINAGLAHLPPTVLYETKVVRAGVQTLAADPFRDVPVSNEESADVASEGDSVLAIADVSQHGVTDRRKRGSSRGGGK